MKRCPSCKVYDGEFHGTFCASPFRGIYKPKPDKQTMPRPKGTKNKPGHRAGRPRGITRTANLPRVTREALDAFRARAKASGQSIAKTIEDSAKNLTQQ